MFNRRAFYPLHQPLGPLHALFFIGIAIAVGILTFRRPVLGIGALTLWIPFAKARFVGTSITIPKGSVRRFPRRADSVSSEDCDLKERPVRTLIAAFGTVLAAIVLSLLEDSAQAHGAMYFSKASRYRW
jgi:hypothetical protein